MYVNASVCDFVCIALLLPFVLGFCLSVVCFCFCFSIVSSTCYHWWICFLVWLLSSFFLLLIFFNNYILFLILITLFYFILLLLYLFYLLSFFLSFLPFILSRVDDRLLVLQPGIRAVHLRWDTQVQDTGPQETYQLHVISNSKNFPESSISTPRPSDTQRTESYSAGHPLPNN